MAYSPKAAAQAAVAVTWQTGTGIKTAEGSSFTTSTSGYTATIALFTDADCTTAFDAGGSLTDTSYATKASAGFAGASAASFDAGTYYTVLTLSNGTKSWTSDVGSFTIAAGATSGITVNFTSGLNLGGSSLINNNAYAVPEPTSGLLALVGFAALVLRRRRA